MALADGHRLERDGLDVAAITLVLLLPGGGLFAEEIEASLGAVAGFGVAALARGVHAC
jgi:hypothetical protein